ncbi:MAG: hypothetical protein OXU79_01870 [Gemmatimonadota bacterium]|nr:hypothetical protein [Gemmatimonadota bacterium]
MPDPCLLISIPGKSFGFVPGQRISIHLHVIGLNKQTVSVRLAINDPLGATRYASGEVSRDLDGGHAVVPFECDLEPDFQAGTHLVTAQVISGAQNFRAIATESFEVVVPGRRLADGFPVAPRDRIIDANYAFEATDAETLNAAFRTAHVECEACRNPDGGWGTVPDAEKPAYRLPSNVILGYLYGYEALGDEQYRNLAVGGLDYLLAEQDENGAFRWWYKGVPGGVMNQRDNFYDTGWAGLALAEGFRVTGEEEYLDAVRRAADWTATCPFTGNNNYDAFALWFLSLLYAFTGEEKHLETAVWRTRGGVFFAQLPRGGWPGHNFHIGYQSITANGLASLYDVLPTDHPFSDPLRDRLCAALNFATFLQTRTGDYCMGWEYDREFRIDSTGTPTGTMIPARSELVRAFYKTDNRLDVPANIFNGLCRSTTRRIESLKSRPDRDRSEVTGLMDVGVLLKWRRNK